MVIPHLPARWLRHLRLGLALFALVVLVATVTAAWIDPALARPPPVPVGKAALATTADRNCATVTAGSLSRHPAGAARKRSPARSAPAKKATPAGKPAPAEKPAPVAPAKLDLNVATKEQLVALPGIGSVKAERIIQWRERRGRFRRVIDLRRVKGFGRKTVRRLRPYLTVSKP